MSRYLENVRTSVPSTRTVADGDLVRTGLADCVLLRNGSSVESLLRLAPHGTSPSGKRLVVATSVESLCPEYRVALGARPLTGNGSFEGRSP